MADSGRTFLSGAVQTQQPHPTVSTCCASTGIIFQPTSIEVLNTTAYVNVFNPGIRNAICFYSLAFFCVGWNFCSEATYYGPFCPQRRSSCASGMTDRLHFHHCFAKQWSCRTMAPRFKHRSVQLSDCALCVDRSCKAVNA